MRIEQFGSPHLVRLVRKQFDYRPRRGVDRESREADHLFAELEGQHRSAAVRSNDAPGAVVLLYGARRAVGPVAVRRIHLEIGPGVLVPCQPHTLGEFRHGNPVFAHQRDAARPDPRHIAVAGPVVLQVLRIIGRQLRPVGTPPELHRIDPLAAGGIIRLPPTVGITVRIELLLESAHVMALILPGGPAAGHAHEPGAVARYQAVPDLQFADETGLADGRRTVAEAEVEHLRRQYVLSFLQVGPDVERIGLGPARIGRCGPPLYTLPVDPEPVAAVGENPPGDLFGHRIERKLLAQHQHRVGEGALRRIPNPAGGRKVQLRLGAAQRKDRQACKQKCENRSQGQTFHGSIFKRDS